MTDLSRINQLVDTMQRLTQIYEDDRRKTQEAAIRERQSLDQVNLAQKQFDEAVILLKGEAPWNSTWYRERFETKRK